MEYAALLAASAMITPRPPKKGDPFWGAKDFAWLLKKAKRKFRGGPGIRVSEKGGDVVISATGGKSWGGKGGAFLNPGFHVEDLGPTEEDGRLARIWGGYVEYAANQLVLFVDNPSDVAKVSYDGSLAGDPSASSVTTNGREAATYLDSALGLNQSAEVEFDPTTAFHVYVEITHENLPSTVKLKTGSGAFPTDTIFVPSLPTAMGTTGVANVKIAEWNTFTESFTIFRRGAINWTMIYGKVLTGS
jgi:hypothetical protein